MNDYTPNGSGSGDEDQGPNPVTYAWDINNDGTYDETGETVTVSWADLTTLYNFSAGDHTVKLKVSDGDVSKDGTDTVTVRIKPPVFSVSITQNMRENSTSPTNGTITLTRTGPANSPALNNVTISIGGSATMAPAANSDYANIATTVSFSAGSLTKTIPVTIFDDSFVEGSETILVAITGGSSTTYQFDSMAAPATGTIEDTDHWRWKTFSGTPGSASPTNPWSNGDSLSFNGSVSATNNSVQTSMTGTYSTTLNGQLAMYSVSGGVNLQFAAVAGAGIHVANREGASQQRQHLFAQPWGECAQCAIGRARLLGANSGACDLEQDLVHGSRGRRRRRKD